MSDMSEPLEPLKRLSRDVAKSAVYLGDREARFLVDSYVQQQKNRIRSNNQIAAIMAGTDEENPPEPHDVLKYLAEQSELLEKQLGRALAKYVENHMMGDWLLNIYGIGPILAAGLIANIDIEQSPTVGHIWRFAGLDPTTRWESKDRLTAELDALEDEYPDFDELAVAAAMRFGRSVTNMQKHFSRTDEKAPKKNMDALTSRLMRRPWSGSMKRLCWLIGESFVKVKGREEDVYGKLYIQRRVLEEEKNKNLDYKDQAANMLKRKKFGKSTDAYKWYSQGMLPPNHLYSRAKRYAVKIFLSHVHAEYYRRYFKTEPPKPFAIAILGHTHMIEGPK